MNRLGPRRMRRQVGKQDTDAEAERESMTDEVMTEFTVEELREFLQGFRPVPRGIGAWMGR